jgi:uncharacterized protein (TIGR04141 family)
MGIPRSVAARRADPRSRATMAAQRTLAPSPARLEGEGPHSGFEPCDLFGPNDELIHIKRMRLRNSASFGHLFNQALVTTEILLDFADARKTFVDAVNGRRADRELRPDFRPRDVLLAFPSKEGPVVPVQSIPVLARVTLSRVAETLEGRGVTLRLVGIDEQLCGWACEPPEPDA